MKHEGSEVKFTIHDSPWQKDEDDDSRQPRTTIELKYHDDGSGEDVLLSIKSWITKTDGSVEPDGANDSSGNCTLSRKSLIELKKSITYIIDNCIFRD